MACRAFAFLEGAHVIADAIYAAAEREPGRPTATDHAERRARATIRRFLQDLPGEITVADLRAELEETE